MQKTEFFGRNQYLIDAHTHLSEGEFSKEIFSLVNATQQKDYEPLKNLCQKNSQIVPFFGLHPWFLKKAVLDWEHNLEQALREFPEAGIGEIGLDKVAADKGKTLSLEEQAEFFVRQLELANKLKRPVAIHCVGAWGKMTEFLERFYPLQEFSKVLLHGYQGSKETAQRLLKRGVFFSFSRVQLEKQPELIQTMPLSHILLETDMLPDKEKVLDEAYTLLSNLFDMEKQKMIERIGKNAAVFTGHSLFRRG